MIFKNTDDYFINNYHMHFYNNNDVMGLDRYFSRDDTINFKTEHSSSRNNTFTKANRIATTKYYPPKPSPITKKDNSSLPTASDEQNTIVKSVVVGNNVIVDSVFGSGKTTTILQICKAMPTVSILVLTYNARLKIETRERCLKLGLQNVETHSYHALTVKYYSDRGNTDNEIKKILETDRQIRNRSGRQFALVILDEQQDMTPLYYGLVKKFINDSKLNNVQIGVLGDTYQNIY